MAIFSGENLVYWWSCITKGLLPTGLPAKFLKWYNEKSQDFCIVISSSRDFRTAIKRNFIISYCNL